ncbi:uncharacterized protein METZ01_LOCUS441646, partial [marine metagenome]
ALPVCDARLLVNLSRPREGQWFLDPCAGVGGLVREARARGARVISSDVDPWVAMGLQKMSGWHVVADVARIPLKEKMISAVASELPFDQSVADRLDAWMDQICAALAPMGRTALMGADWQGEGLRGAGQRAGLSLDFELAIKRKGRNCVVQVWEKA